MHDRAMRLRERLDQVVVLRGEEPDGAALILVVQDLRRHGLAVAFLDAREPEHHGAVVLDRLPQFRFQLVFGFGHGDSSGV